MEDKPLISDNAIRINGIINVPEGEHWEKFWDDLILWLEGQNGGFFGVTEPIDQEVEGESVIEKILEDTGLKFDE